MTISFDGNKPTLTDNYLTAFLPNLQANLQALGTWLDSALVTTANVPSGTKRINSSTGTFEQWSGTAWAAMGVGYALKGGDTFSGAMTFANNVALQWKDSGGAARRSGVLTSTNNYVFGDVDNAIAGGITYIAAKASVSVTVNAATVATFNAAGISIPGSLSAASASLTGSLTAGGAVLNGTVTINAAGGSYNEGLRIASSSGNSFADIALGCDLSGSGTIAGQWNIQKLPNGNFQIANQTGAAQLSLTQSGDVGAASSMSAARIFSGYDAAATGGISCSNWFRTNGNTGMYFADTSSGVMPPQGDYGSVGTYGAKGTWGGFSINGGVVFMHSNSSTGTWGIYNDYNNTWMLQSDMGGNATFTGNVTAYSDERLKTDWKDLPGDFLERLADVKMGTFTRIDSGARQIGVGARSLQPLMPDAVMEREGVLSVAYGNAALASAVVLAREVMAVRARLDALEAC